MHFGDRFVRLCIFLNQCRQAEVLHGLREFFKLLYLFDGTPLCQVDD
jgi:hypothetical protein